MISLWNNIIMIDGRNGCMWLEMLLTQSALISDDKETSQTELGWLLLWFWAGQYKYIHRFGLLVTSMSLNLTLLQDTEQIQPNLNSFVRCTKYVFLIRIAWIASVIIPFWSLFLSVGWVVAWHHYGYGALHDYSNCMLTILTWMYCFPINVTQGKLFPKRVSVWL